MILFVIKRFFILLLVLLVTSFLVFVIIHQAPGDPIQIIYGKNPQLYNKDTIDKVRSQYGLDKPIFIQYGYYMQKLLSGDMGKSISTGRDVFSSITAKIPATVILSLSALFISLITAVPLGVISAIKRHRIFDHLSRIFAVVSISMPGFWLGLIFIYFFSIKLRLFLPSGVGSLHSGLGDFISHLIMPSLVLAIGMMGNAMRLMRTSMIQVLRQDYIRTAYAKGLSKKNVILKHALKNAMIPLLTHTGLQFGELLGGSVIVEKIFSWPGIGLLMTNAIFRRDYPVILGCTLVLVTFFIVINSLVDIMYTYLNPKVRL